MTHPLRTGLLALPLIVVLAATGRPVAAGDAVPQRVSVRLMPSALIENQDLKAVVRIEQEPVHRRLVVALDGPAFYSSTLRDLKGERALRTHEFYFRSLPAGSYLLSVSIEEAGGEVHVTERRFEVHGQPVEGTEPSSRAGSHRSRRKQ
jgi:hypothetical protein